MTITTTAKVLPYVATRTYLRLARVPLTAAQRVTGHHGDEQWPPTMAFETFEAGVESVVGSLVGDSSLTQSAAVRRAKLAKLREASVLRTEAKQTRRQADESFEARRDAAEQQREEAARKAKQREAEVEKQAAKREQAAKQKTAKKTAAARKTKAKQDEVIEREERAAKLEALDAEAEALDAAKEAVDAEATVDVIEDTIEGQKEDRKTG
jgi:type IV secretory pathway VirB10-like protein